MFIKDADGLVYMVNASLSLKVILEISAFLTFISIFLGKSNFRFHFILCCDEWFLRVGFFYFFPERGKRY